MRARSFQHVTELVTTMLVVLLSGLAGPAAAEDDAAVPSCATRGRSLVIVDDSVNVPAWMADRSRAFQLPPAAQTMQALDAWRECLTVLDNDPLFWVLAGSVQPDFILRVRITELQAAERSLGDKAGIAVGRYIGSYLGQTADEVPVLKSAAVAVDLICPKSRRKVTTVAGRGLAAELPRAEQNAERLHIALEAAAQDVSRLLTATNHPCQPLPAS